MKNNELYMTQINLATGDKALYLSRQLYNRVGIIVFGHCQTEKGGFYCIDTILIYRHNFLTS